MKLSELIDNWEPGDWAVLKKILVDLAVDRDDTADTSPSEGE